MTDNWKEERQQKAEKLWIEATEAGIEFEYTRRHNSDLFADYKNLRISNGITLSDAQTLENKFKVRIMENQQDLGNIARDIHYIKQVIELAKEYHSLNPEIYARLLQDCYHTLDRQLNEGPPINESSP